VQGFPEFDENVRQGCGNSDRRAPPRTSWARRIRQWRQRRRHSHDHPKTRDRQ